MNELEHAVPEELLMELAAQRVEAATGLQFAGARRRQFHAALGHMAEAIGQRDAEGAAAWLLADDWDAARSDVCARYLTIGETYFFREPRALDLVCEQARAHLARGESRPLRIWSAGCCTGEEPYSIAMALRRRVPQLAPAMAAILATDLNEGYLDFARLGVYRRWSFRNTEAADHAGFFRPLDDGRFAIDTGLRAQVRFARLNLAGAIYPSAATGTLAMDVIFCRNVLMYFSPEQARAVVLRLRDCLVDGGWLVVNASEASPELFAGLTPVVLEDAVFFRKGGATAVPVVPAAPRVRDCVDVAAAPARPAAPAPAPAPAAAPAPCRDAMARVRSLLEQGSRDEALQCLRRAVEADPLSVPLQRSAALFAFEHGDRALARDGVKRLLYLEPDSALGHYLAALIEDAEGRRARARRLLQDCRRLAAAGADHELDGAAASWMERLQ